MQLVQVLLVLLSNVLLFFLVIFLDLLDPDSLLFCFKLQDLVFIEALKRLLVAECALKVVQHVLSLRRASTYWNNDFSRVLVGHGIRFTLVLQNNRVVGLGTPSGVGRSRQLILSVLGFTMFARCFFLFFAYLLYRWRGRFGFLKNSWHIKTFFFTFVRVRPLLSFFWLYFFVVVWRSLTFFQFCSTIKFILISHLWSNMNLGPWLEVEITYIYLQGRLFRSRLLHAAHVWTSVGSVLAGSMITGDGSLALGTGIDTRACRRPLHHSLFLSRELRIDNLDTRINWTLATHSCCIELIMMFSLIWTCRLWPLLLPVIPSKVLIFGLLVTRVVTWILLTSKKRSLPLLQYFIVWSLVRIATF